MNEKVWHEIMRNYIKDYENIRRLSTRGVLNEEQSVQLKNNLLTGIITTFVSEVASEEAEEVEQ